MNPTTKDQVYTVILFTIIILLAIWLFTFLNTAIRKVISNEEKFLFECGREGYSINLCRSFYKGGIRDANEVRTECMQQHIQ